MGCVSSNFLNHDDNFSQLGSSALSHHIVSLTSSTYGLLSLDPPPHHSTPTIPTTPPSRFTFGSIFPNPLSEPKSLWSESRPVPSDPEVINSWELMAGLDTADSFRFSPLPPPKAFAFKKPITADKDNTADSFRFSPLPPPKAFAFKKPITADKDNTADSFRFSPLPPPKTFAFKEPITADKYNTADSFRFSPLLPPKAFAFKEPITADKENSNPNRSTGRILKPQKDNFLRPLTCRRQNPLDGFEKICPPNGENRVVIYTTTLRGVRKTFEECNAVRAAIQGAGVMICERDVSMDRGFKEELKELMKSKGKEAIVPPRVFVKGWYVGGAEELLKIAEDGFLSDLFEGLPERRVGSVCEGCGDVRFLPCFQCNGSAKMVMAMEDAVGQRQGATVVVRCTDCNENGLVLCPICS